VSALRHLYASRAAVSRQVAIEIRGITRVEYQPLNLMIDPIWGVPGELLCRVDLNFTRPGKDQLPPVVTGRAPERVGVMFCDVTNLLKDGDRLTMLSGPITGQWDLWAVPDVVVGYSEGHHIEVAVISVPRSLGGQFSGEPLGEDPV
jgi:hypothetical protein